MAGTRPKLAAITTVYRKMAHTQHVVDRYLEGYGWNGTHHHPEMDLIALYVDQVGADDLSRDRAARFPTMKIYPTIAEALTCGTGKLAVDGVVVVGEHGEYPKTPKGQVQYPRYRFFEEIVAVFRSSGRSVPMFNDKHLSWNWEWAKKMYDTSKEMGFAYMAGSSLPVTWRLPELELPLECEIEDALMVGCGGSDAMDFHALEAMQCMLERRKGGEKGVKSVQLLEGDAVWNDGRWSKELLRSALSRSDNLKGATVTDGRTQDMVGTGVLPQIVRNPWAYFIEYRDGTKATMMMLSDAVADFNIAVKVKGNKEIQATQFFLSPDPNVTYSACLASKIEQMIMTGAAPYPVERTLLVSGMLEACLDSRVKGHQKIETPHLDVVYQAPRESQYCRV